MIRKMSGWKTPLLLMLVLGMLLCFVLVSRLEHFTREAHLYLRYFMVAFTLYIIACSLLWNVNLGEYQWLPFAVFSVAILFRMPFWFSQPSLSSDVWRYLWDGRLISQGANPYLERVDALIVGGQAEVLRSKIQHQWMASPYPPAAQAAFGLIYLLFPMSATAMQVTFSLIDLAIGALLIRILKHRRLPSGRALLYLWSPLVVVEFAHSAHIDSLMILLVLVAALFTLNSRQTLSAVSLGFATVTKYIPALFLPVFMRRWSWRNVCVYIVSALIVYVPFLGAGLGIEPGNPGTGIFGALRIYLRQWSTNGGIYFWLVEIINQLGVAEPERIVKAITVLVLGMIGVWIYARPNDRDAPDGPMIIDGMILLLSAYLLLSAAVFPWYLTLLIALAAALPVDENPAWRLVLIAWIYFSAAVNLSYLFYIDPGNPAEIEWVRWLEYLPLLIMLAAALILKLYQSRQTSNAFPPPEPSGDC
jgi:hypothetical protein